MTRVLSLAVAAVLVTSSFAQFNPFFRRADDSEVIDPADCRGEGWENDLVKLKLWPHLVHFINSSLSFIGCSICWYLFW